jgi:hypothetical protein
LHRALSCSGQFSANGRHKKDWHFPKSGDPRAPGRFDLTFSAVIAEQQESVTQSSILGYDIQIVVALYHHYNSLILLQKKGNAAL